MGTLGKKKKERQEKEQGKQSRHKVREKKKINKRKISQWLKGLAPALYENFTCPLYSRY